MKCALCLVDKETVPVKLNLATLKGSKDEMFSICKECLDLAHQAYIDRDFLAVKAGSNAAPHGAHGIAHDSSPSQGERHMCTRQQIDQYIFIKNGYSIIVHIIPFAIASLLLLVTSLPSSKSVPSLSANDLLSQLANALQEFNIIWLPAFLLTVIALVIYFLTLRLQVIKAYLWSKNNNKRIVFTVLIFTVLCWFGAFLVLALAPPSTDSPLTNSPLTNSSSKSSCGNIWACLKNSFSLGNIWASLLLVLISLIGVGWGMLGSLAESIGIKSPDYSEAHLKAEEIAKFLKKIRKKAISEVNDVENFKDSAQKLLDDIMQNREENEPEWARSELNEPCIKLENLINAVDTEFKEKEYAIDFASACQYKTDMYPVFTEALKSISELWIEWQPCNEGP